MTYKHVVLALTALLIGNVAVSLLYQPRYGTVAHVAVTLFVASSLKPRLLWPVALSATLALAAGSYAIFSDTHSWSYLAGVRPFAIFTSFIVLGGTVGRYKLYKLLKEQKPQ
jgi:hypothetical protein